jgi:hypothetical protein
MGIGGSRATAGMRHALAEAGLGRTSTLNGAEIRGWIAPDHYGSTGFSVKTAEDGNLVWHVVLSGKPHLRYRTFIEKDGKGGDITMYEPINMDLLHTRIAAAVRSLGIDVREVRSGGYQTHWDDDVDYEVVTRHPDWLGPFRIEKTFPLVPGKPTLFVGSIDLKEFHADATLGEQVLSPGVTQRVSQPRHGYPCYVLSDLSVALTRESIDDLLAANATILRTKDWWRKPQALAIDERGLVLNADDGGTVRLAERMVFENAWGDTVEGFRVLERGVVRCDPWFRPRLPVLVAGSMRTDAGFVIHDSQFGLEAPWSVSPASPAARP